MRDSFAEHHPFINLIYFISVIGFSLALAHPLAQVISLTCAVIYAVSVSGKKSILFLLKYCLPAVILTAIINPVFNHQGVTTLLYFPNGNPLTLESILYGLSAGLTVITTLMWFSSFNRVMTTDKFVFLFGRVIPALSLVLSMSLRFVPKFRSQMESVTEAQRSIGRDVSSGSLIQRTKTAVLIFSIMITWSLENAVETADSMKSRGYGLKGRSAFAIYRFDKRDKYALVLILLFAVLLIAGIALSAFRFSYFPHISCATFDITTIPFYFVYSALCITPVIINCKEERKWKASVSEV